MSVDTLLQYATSTPEKCGTTQSRLPKVNISFCRPVYKKGPIGLLYLLDVNYPLLGIDDTGTSEQLLESIKVALAARVDNNSNDPQAIREIPGVFTLDDPTTTTEEATLCSPEIESITGLGLSGTLKDNTDENYNFLVREAQLTFKTRLIYVTKDNIYGAGEGGLIATVYNGRNNIGEGVTDNQTLGISIKWNGIQDPTRLKVPFDICQYLTTAEQQATWDIISYAAAQSATTSAISITGATVSAQDFAFSVTGGSVFSEIKITRNSEAYEDIASPTISDLNTQIGSGTTSFAGESTAHSFVSGDVLLIKYKLTNDSSYRFSAPFTVA